MGALLACGDNNTHSPVVAPGEATAPLAKALDVGAEVLQGRPPVDELNAYLDGFHFYNGRMQEQMEAHHYCSILNEEVIQCVIFDGNMKDAKLMGVEYIVSEQQFLKLPEQEKALWHSHVHEVKSGQLIAPGIPQPAEHALMEKLVRTYGKTWHTWHTDMDKQLPLGVPQLMMGFTADGQVDEQMVAERDKRFGISSAANKEARKDIAAPALLPGADAWKEGRAIQIQDPTGNRHPAHE
nr:OBAP family protein [Pseudomonas cichorii]